MASKKKKKKTSTTSQRKLEVLGLLMVAVASLLALAIVSYSPQDESLVRSFEFSYLRPGTVEAANLLGIVGAFLAHLLVPSFLGYTTLLLPGLLAAWGYVIFRGKEIVTLPFVSGVLVVSTFFIAALIGWFGVVLESDMGRIAGAWGVATAHWFTYIFGAVGACILLSVALLCSLIVVIDHDLHRTFDRIEAAFSGLFDRVASWWNERRARWVAWRAERKALRDERRRQAEERRNEKAAQKEEKQEQFARAREEGMRKGRQRAAAQTERATPTNHDRLRARTQQQAPATPSAPSPAPATAEPPPSPAPAQPTTGGDSAPADESGVTLRVQEQIEEERTDHIEREEGPGDIPFHFPDIQLLDEAPEGEHSIDQDELQENKEILLDKLSTYNIEISEIDVVVGPTVTRYELIPAPGVKISRITAREDDLAMALAASGIRMIAPIPGKSAVGVEIPNRSRELVRIRDVIGTTRFAESEMELPMALGKTIEGEVYLRDLTKMPHLLIAGATGSGKSVGVNGIIVSLLYACHPESLKFVIIDPKKIELQQYAHLRNHYLARFPGTDDEIITDFEEALGVLKSCEKEMERRYDLLSEASVRGIKDYNRKFEQGTLSEEDGHRHLPYIVVVVDELADLMMTAGKDIEGPIARLAQMARAVGIHLILATQRPSVDVITGLIKANFPARMAFQVASRIDSRTILDQGGAEGLVGNGDMLYMLGSAIKRIQSPLVTIEEVDHVVDFIADQQGPGMYELPKLEDPADLDLDDVLASTDRDDLFEQAAHLIVRAQQGSVSLLQRKLSVGYTRAARIVDQLEDAGIVGPFEGSKARQVLVADEEELEAAFAQDKQDD